MIGWKNQTLTPSPDTIYLFPFYNTKERDRWSWRFHRLTEDRSPAAWMMLGKRLKPNPKTQDILNEAAAEAHAWFDGKYEKFFSPPYFEGTPWAVPVPAEVIQGLQTNFADPNSYPVDGRAVMYSIAYFSAKHLGAGQFYLFAIEDKEGRPLGGGNTYRLKVPSKVPIRLYWSATAYDRATHALIQDTQWSSRASTTPELETNPASSTSTRDQ